MIEKIAVTLISSIIALVTALLVARKQAKQQFQKLVDESTIKRKERLKEIVDKYSRPILLAASDLQDRLWHLTQREATSSSILLEADIDQEKSPRWTMTRKHYLASTLFLFARYFAWVEILRQEVQFLEFGLQDKQNETRQFFEKLKSVDRILSSTEIQNDEIETDRQIFQLQQALIGQLMIKQGQNGVSCINFAEFVENFDSKFENRDEFIILENLIMQAVSRNVKDFCLSRCCLLNNKLVEMVNLLDPEGLFVSRSERELVSIPT